jgi:hypothetical protein
VDQTPINNPSIWTIDYNLSGANLYAAQLGAFYFSRVAANIYRRSDFQVAIWLYHNIGSGHEDFGNLRNLLNGNRWQTLSTSGLAIARSSINQDPLVHVSEPATLFLLGIGMIGLAIARRKKFLKK